MMYLKVNRSYRTASFNSRLTRLKTKPTNKRILSAQMSLFVVIMYTADVYDIEIHAWKLKGYTPTYSSACIH